MTGATTEAQAFDQAKAERNMALARGNVPQCPFCKKFGHGDDRCDFELFDQRMHGIATLLWDFAKQYGVMFFSCGNCCDTPWIKLFDGITLKRAFVSPKGVSFMVVVGKHPTYGYDIERRYSLGFDEGWNPRNQDDDWGDDDEE